jgi:ribosome biogenesis GTPase
MQDLLKLGLDEAQVRAFEALEHAELTPGRVSAVDRGRHRVLTLAGEVWSSPAGRLFFEGGDATPLVGDAVAVRRAGGGYQTVQILPRRTLLRRKAAGLTAAAQGVAANLDHVFVVTAVGQDFNPRRIERYVAMVRGGGAAPVVVVTKTDLPFDVVALTRAADEAAPGLPLVLVSSLSRGGLDELQPFLQAGRTVALVGSSGVGKSTLANALLQEDRFATRAVRAHDERGRHATTRRELVQLPDGAWLIDTPGMRELGLVGDEAAVDAAFDELADLAQRCRYGDCQHASEPGCAVQEALREGRLSEARWASYVKLKREAAFAARREDDAAEREHQKKWRAIHMEMRERRKYDPKLRR